MPGAKEVHNNQRTENQALKARIAVYEEQILKLQDLLKHSSAIPQDFIAAYDSLRTELKDAKEVANTLRALNDAIAAENHKFQVENRKLQENIAKCQPSFNINTLLVSYMALCAAAIEANEIDPDLSQKHRNLGIGIGFAKQNMNAILKNFPEFALNSTHAAAAASPPCPQPISTSESDDVDGSVSALTQVFDKNLNGDDQSNSKARKRFKM